MASCPVELGAEFIHGLPPELIHLVDEAGLTRFELEGDYPLLPEQHGAGRWDLAAISARSTSCSMSSGTSGPLGCTRPQLQRIRGPTRSWTGSRGLGDQLCRRLQRGRCKSHQHPLAGETAGGGRCDFGRPCCSGWWKAMPGSRSFCCADSSMQAASGFRRLRCAPLPGSRGGSKSTTAADRVFPGGRGNRHFASGRSAGEKRCVCARNRWRFSLRPTGSPWGRPRAWSTSSTAAFGPVSPAWKA